MLNDKYNVGEQYNVFIWKSNQGYWSIIIITDHIAQKINLSVCFSPADILCNNMRSIIIYVIIAGMTFRAIIINMTWQLNHKDTEVTEKTYVQ